MKIHTIEVNIGEDVANSCAYHIDSFENTSRQNIRRFVEKIEGDTWVIVGLAFSLSEAHEKCKRLQDELCKMKNVRPYGIEELLQKMADEL